ncbi:hypothetical protein [Nocardia sp. 348MFTsu5.1]|uniref:hypothetical protein n=1 Tax=Nocardia sp. 348MFTsu5.1 TaxID=1172185 RepID=UPI00039BCD4C|nr:hypothetical protein [Nocardia sp. 348MFTsu5.1]
MANKARAATAERVGRALEMRSGGATWSSVADQLGYRSANAAEASVRQYVGRAAEGTDIGQLLMMEELKLQQRERYIMAAAEKVSERDVSGRDTVDKARDRIAKHRAFIHGLGKVNVGVDVNVSASPGAILDRAEADLLALAQHQPQIIDAEVVTS